MKGELTIDEQLDMLGDLDLEDSEIEIMERASRFHGHICPGLAIGVAASMEFLGNEERSDDEEIVAIVENDACGVDAIQTLLGCTFGKGNLVFKDHGKSVYTFFKRDTGKGQRFSVRDILFNDMDDETRNLISRVRSGDASPDERISFQRLWVEKAGEVMMKRKELFDITDVKEDVPEKARIFESFTCPSCGEKAGSHRAAEVEGKQYCIPCSEEVVE